MQSQPSILIVDDELDNFDVIETLLDGEGYLLNYASSGQKALERIHKIQPDLILLDVMMPELNGMEVCRSLKANPAYQAIPIIMVTALTSKEDLARCLNAGADDFISKPVNSIELRARVRSMLRIKKQHDALQEILAVREDLSHMMVHDLRNPLASILFSAQILKHPNLAPERQQEKVDRIIQSGQQLQSLIDSLLLIAKLESGKIVLNLTDADLSEICQSALQDFEAIAAYHNLQLVGDFPDSQQTVKVDMNLFRRVIDNLLSNAIKFSPSDSQIFLKVAYPTPGKVKIQIIDSGPGVSEEFKQIIFEKYEIGNLIQGVSQIGLGLAFCKMAVHAHTGEILVENNYPQGSIFTVEI